MYRSRTGGKTRRYQGDNKGRVGPRRHPAAMASSDAKQQKAETTEETTDTGEKQNWNVEAEPFHPYVGSMVRPLTRGEVRTVNGGGGYCDAAPAQHKISRSESTRRTGASSARNWGPPR